MQTETTVELVAQLKQLVSEERRINKEILILLNKVEDRRIYAEMGYPSLFQFCTDYLGYSEGAAVRRINSARLLQKEPASVAAKLESGELSISTASMIERHLRREKKSGAIVKALVEELSGKSQREVERILVAKAPESLAREVVTPKTETHSELRLNISRECEKKLEKLRAHFAHKNKSMGELFEKLVSEELSRVEKDKFGGVRVQKSAAVKIQRKLTSPGMWKFEHTNLRKTLPKQTKRHVYQTAQGQCEYVSPITKQRCPSHYLLQIEHKTPLARNGTNTRANLELLCRAHNLLRRDESFLKKK